MKKESIWLQDLKINKNKPLDKDIEVDVLIIGGGLTGISTAYNLRNEKLNICLVEQNFIGSGVTSKSTAKINYLQEVIHTDIYNKYDKETARKYYQSQIYAIDKIKEIIKKENIDCDLEEAESYTFTNKKEEISTIKNEKEILEEFGAKVYEHTKIDLPLKSKYAISVKDTYVFHPIKYLYALKDICEKKGIQIYEDTRILKMTKCQEGYICSTSANKITAKKVIIASHYPFFLKPYMMPLKVYNEKSYVTASKIKDYKNETYITSETPTKSVRYYKDKNNYIIYLSNSHSISTNENHENNFLKTIKEVKKLKLNPDYVWSNEDVITVDKIPYIGYIEKNNNNLLIGTGYNTWGMTNSILASFILKDLILGNHNEFEELTNPKRVYSINNIGSILYNVMENTKSYICTKVNKNKSWYNKDVKFEVRDGKNVAIYNDGKKEHIVYSTCPHMGCTLLFNEFEKTWDCPCHASRFDLDGKCIKGPANYDISYKEKD